MRTALHCFSFIIPHGKNLHVTVTAIRLHNLNLIAHTELVALLHHCVAVLCDSAYNAKICVLTNVGIVIVDLSLMGRFAIEESCRILAIGTL